MSSDGETGIAFDGRGNNINLVASLLPGGPAQLDRVNLQRGDTVLGIVVENDRIILCGKKPLSQMIREYCRDGDEQLTLVVMRPAPVATTTEPPRRDPAATREIFAHFEPRNSFEVPLGADGSSSSSTSRRRNARWPAPRASDAPPVPPPAPSAFEEEVEPSHAFVLPRPPADSFGELRKALLPPPPPTTSKRRSRAKKSESLDKPFALHGLPSDFRLRIM